MAGAARATSSVRSNPPPVQAFTQDYPGRTIANWVEFLEQVDQRLTPEIERVYAILDNLNTHHADDVLLFGARPSALGVRLPAQIRRLLESRSSPGGRSCARWPSKDAASRRGRNSPLPCGRRPPTGMRTSIRLFGAADDGTAHAALQASPASRQWHERAGCPTSGAVTMAGWGHLCDSGQRHVDRDADCHR